ncbi:ArdK family transcriptional regulator [Escherichia coli]|nr:ArdK family transcriptional regulator [Escherichia coli]
MAQKRKISDAEWARLLPLMESFASVTTEIAYAVLVKGESQVDVAARKQRTKQSIGMAVKRVWDLYQNTPLEADKGEQLKLVNVWLPEAYAEKVMKEALKYPINNK